MSKIICQITWAEDDLAEIFAEHDIPLTKKNIEKFIETGVSRTLEEVSIERGWEALSDLAFSFKREVF